MVKSRRLIAAIFLVTGLLLVKTFYNSSRTVIRTNQQQEIKHIRMNNGAHANVFFLKVHKSASSTVQNILMRYGHSHQLNFVLPYTDNYFGHPEPFNPSMALPIEEGQSYNVFCHHSRFNESGVEQILPSDTIYVAIIRDPAYLFESIFAYYDLSTHYGMNIEDFVDMPKWWFKTCPRRIDRIGINQIAFDFGIDEKDFSDATKVENYIENLDRIFDLVLIAEYFEESIILLKHVLNLDLQDVAYISLNERINTTRINITQKMAEKLRTVNEIDQKIYEHFLDTFRLRVERFGLEKMESEVKELRRMNEHWMQYCGFRKVNETRHPDPMFEQYQSYKLQAIELEDKAKTEAMCKYLALPEIQFTFELRKNHVKLHGSIWQRLLYLIGYYQY